MFTGLIEAVGRAEWMQVTGGTRELRISTPLAAELQLGDSIAVNGVCLTVTDRDATRFAAQVSPETLRVTSLGRLPSGRLVNLERPMKADGRLGGHFVLGHVDGVAEVIELRPDDASYWLEIELPAALAPLVISKGSIAVDGISLTVARLSSGSFGVQIVPHTWAHTALSGLHAGDAVNLEADVIGKYVARLMDLRRAEDTASVGPGV
jgi:riboflavin synthase